jgi:hypothetical protein
MKKLVREGYEVEKHVRDLFDNQGTTSIDYQKTFKTSDGLTTRTDGFETCSNGEVCLYEIKSSTSIKSSGNHNHIKDATFQTITAERSGQKIDRIYLIHLNGKYVRQGDIDPKELLKIVEITDQVRELYEETSFEIDEALLLLNKKKIDNNGCGCVFKSKSHHCDTFNYFNPDIPKNSLYNLPRLSDKKRYNLVSKGAFDLTDIPSELALSEIQSLVIQATKAGRALINRKAILALLAGYHFPLYFFDYETFASAVPIMDKASPHNSFPVQYSLHILYEDGKLEHKEFLQRNPQLPLNLVKQMENDFGNAGSVVSWHASFEKTQNSKMGKWFPEKEEFLNNLSERMVDLEDMFKMAYVDARFKGSTSIKKVLPVICPHLGYEDLDVQDGATAMDAWQRMTSLSGAEAETEAQALLAYCKMDTLAMVEIYKFLRKLTD